MISRLALAVVGALTLAGCAVDPDGGFADIGQTLSERLGNDVRWNRGAEDAQVTAAIERLLELPLTADSAVQIALLNNRRLQGLYERIGIAQADLVAAGLLQNPVFSAEVLFGGEHVGAKLNVVQDFFGVLTLSARRSIAANVFDAIKYEVGQNVLSIAAEVRAAYYSVVADAQALELFDQVVSATEAAAELGHRQGAAGNMASRDQALQQALYARSVLERARIETHLNQEREKLNRLLGLWGDQIAWNVPGRLPEIVVAKPAFDGLEQVAIERRLDLAGARQDLQAATQAAQLTRQMRFLSILGIGVVFEREADSGRWLKGPTIELALPLFDHGQARVARADAERRRTETAFVALAVDIRSEVRAAWQRMVAAQDTAEFYRSQVLPLQQRIVEDSGRLYNGMLLGVYELLRTRQDQITAGRDYIAALKDYWLARAELERVLAGPLPTSTAATGGSL